MQRCPTSSRTVFLLGHLYLAVCWDGEFELFYCAKITTEQDCANARSPGCQWLADTGICYEPCGRFSNDETQCVRAGCLWRADYIFPCTSCAGRGRDECETAGCFVLDDNTCSRCHGHSDKGDCNSISCSFNSESQCRKCARMQSQADCEAVLCVWSDGQCNGNSRLYEKESTSENEDNDNTSTIVIITILVIIALLAILVVLYLIFKNQCLDSFQRRRSDKAARKMGLATNAEIFVHPLNKLGQEGKDPRSWAQRQAGPSGQPESLAKDITVNSIGFTPQKNDNSHDPTVLLSREDSRAVFHVHSCKNDDWIDKDVIIALGHKRLTVTDNMTITLAFKDVSSAPKEARWRFVRAQGENWNILSVAHDGMALTCSLAPKTQPSLSRLVDGQSTQWFQYTKESTLLLGGNTELALWVSGDDEKHVQVVPRKKNVSYAKNVNYKNKKGVAKVKQKQVAVDVDYARNLKWSVLPEEQHLVLLPRLLRTTHAHSPFFRVPGEDVRRMELATGPEKHVSLRGERLIAYSPLLPFILGAAEGSWQTDKFWALCQLLGCPLVDRTGTLSVPLRMKILHPIPRMEVDPGPLPPLLRDRARALLKKGTSDRPLQILWSGGIDTTAVVCAFLDVTRENLGERKRLLIRYCPRSISEYPDFFTKFITVSGVPYREIEGHVRDVFEQGPTVTGDPADMLMGTFVMAKAFKGRKIDGQDNPLHWCLDKPWEKIIPAWLRSRGLLQGSDQRRDPEAEVEKEWIDWLKPFVQSAPIPIVTMFDWLWWVTYACKYQHDLMRVFYNRDVVPETLRENVINFFEHFTFDQWSFHHHEEKMPDKRVWASYKFPLKKFILDHTGDDNYFAHKTKVQSVRNSWGFELGITDQWEVIRFGKFSVSMRRMREKYGRDLDKFIMPKTLMNREHSKDNFEDEFMPYLLASTAVAGAAGFLTLAAFQNAEVFNPDKVDRPSDAGASSGGE